MSEQLQLNELTDQLVNEGLLAEENLPQVAATVTQDDDSQMPWYIAGLSGCGGWVGAMFFFSSISCCLIQLAIVGDDERTIASILIFYGLVLFVGSIFGRRWVKPGSGGIALGQFLFALHIAAHTLIASGVFVLLDLTDASIALTAIIVLILQIIAIILYDDAIFRFLSVLVASSAVSVVLYEWSIPLSLSFLAGGLAIVVVVLGSDGILNQAIFVRYYNIIRNDHFTRACDSTGALEALLVTAVTG